MNIFEKCNPFKGWNNLERLQRIRIVVEGSLAAMYATCMIIIAMAAIHYLYTNQVFN